MDLSSLISKNYFREKREDKQLFRYTLGRPVFYPGCKRITDSNMPEVIEAINKHSSSLSHEALIALLLCLFVFMQK